jgi:cytochrome c5
MKKMIVIASAMILVVSCTMSKSAAPSQANVDAVADKFPGYTLADLNRGKDLYEANCQTCHKLAKPNSESENAWNHIVPEMVEKTNRKAGKQVLDANGEQLILRYLITMSK